ncbi:MAG: UDP-3-O-(3-hydroxymyristoyl)glucosamine N-acyltransferase [Pseudomonadota bacterium]
MEATLKEIARLIGGTLEGNPDTVVRNITGIDKAGEGDLTFVANPKYAKYIEGTGASGIICSPDISVPGKNLLKVDNPYLAYAKIMNYIFPAQGQSCQIDERAFVGKNVRLGQMVTLYPFAYIGDGCVIDDKVTIYPHCFIGCNVSIGEQTLIYPNVTVREGCRIGRRVIIQAGSVIGSDGFGFAKDGPKYYKIPQIGNVQIDDDVEIGAGNTIDRAALGTTWIQRGVKTDNQVHIAHNVIVGEDTVLVAQVGISGSTKIGNRVTLAGQVGTVGHITIGDDVIVGAKGGISADIPPGQIVSGAPHMPHRTWLKAVQSFQKLPDLRRAVHQLEKKVDELAQKTTKE